MKIIKIIFICYWLIILAYCIEPLSVLVVAPNMIMLCCYLVTKEANKDLRL